MKWLRTLWPRAKYDKTSTVSVTLVLPDAIVEAMRFESERGLPNETGGVLVGHVDAVGRTVITAMIGPGPRAFRTPARFRRDGEYAQREVDRLHRESDGRADYVGEWHSHPAAVGPSGVDRGSMEWIGQNERYRREEPFLIIMQRIGARTWCPLIYRWIGGRLTEVGAVSIVD